MPIYNLSEALEEFCGDDLCEAYKWLYRFFCRAAQKVMHYRTKAGAIRALLAVPTDGDAQDVAQEMLTALCKCQQKFGSTIPAPYAMRIWRNVRLKWHYTELRQNGRMRVLPKEPESDQSERHEQQEEADGRLSDQAGPSARSKEAVAFSEWFTSQSAAENQRVLRSGFETIRAKSTGARRKQYEVLHLYYYEDLSLAEIATRMGVPSVTVRGWHKRGLQHFKQEMLGSDSQ